MRRSFRELPLLWRLMIPFLALMLSVGLLGGIVIVGNIRTRATADLDATANRAYLNARTRVHDRELYLLETANFAANVQGMSDVVAARDSAQTTHLLQSVVALKTDVELLVATDSTGTGVSELTRTRSAPPLSTGAGTDWLVNSFVRSALQSTTGEKTSGLLKLGGTSYVAIAAPVCSMTDGCHPTGVALAGLSLPTIVIGARSGDAGIGVFGAGGHVLGRSGLIPQRVERTTGSTLARRSASVRGARLAVVTGPLTVKDKTVATLAVAVRSGATYATLRSTGIRLALILVLAMGGIVAVGVLLSRGIVGELRGIMATNRVLGEGELTVRVPVGSGGELGELAAGTNRMAEQLQASVETLELRVSERTEEIRRLLSERNEFFAGLSHELRTPIAAILAQADLLATAEKSGVEAAPVLQASGQQLLHVINEILEVAKAEAGRLEVNLTDVKVGDAVRELKPTFSALASRGDVKLSVKVPRDLPSVHADPARLREILLNLVDNAVKYTPPGGRVEVSAAARDGLVDVRVTDSGVGIPEEAGQQIFEPFFRVKGTKTHRGQDSSGLGLAVAKRLVEAQGGEIGYESNGKGTVFWVALVANKS